MKKLLLTIAILGALLAGCKKKDNTPATPSTPSTTPQTSGDMIPLKVGNQWTYRGIDYSDTTTMPMDTFPVAITVDSSVNVNGKLWYWTTFFDATTDLWTNKSGGVYDSTFGVTGLIYKYPSNVNDRYWSDFFVDTMLVVSTNASVTTPDGTFSCYHLREIYLGQPISDDYVAPGIGIVRFDIYYFYSTGDLADRFELSGHVLN